MLQITVSIVTGWWGCRDSCSSNGDAVCFLFVVLLFVGYLGFVCMCACARVHIPAHPGCLHVCIVPLPEQKPGREQEPGREQLVPA